MEEFLENETLVGGQAVIEGVMMRAPGRIAMALRKQDGSILVEAEDFSSLVERKKYLKSPVLRGAVMFFEMLGVGFKYLNRSADAAIEEEREASGKAPESRGAFKEFLQSWGPMVLALFLALLFFMFIPLKIAEFAGVKTNGLSFNAIAGVVRLVFFIVYLLLIRTSADIRRIFEYHGAEHKVVFSYEAGKQLDVSTASGFGTLHPRCGTSFIMVVIVLAILFYGLVDALVIAFIATPTAPVRFLYHLALLPLVGGLSYEIIRLAGLKGENLLFHAAVWPGLMLQKITTGEPGEDQLEIAVEALKEALRRGAGTTRYSVKPGGENVAKT